MKFFAKVSKISTCLSGNQRVALEFIKNHDGATLDMIVDYMWDSSKVSTSSTLAIIHSLIMESLLEASSENSSRASSTGKYIIWTPPNPSRPGSQKSPQAVFDSEKRALEVAESMQSRLGGEFYVLKAVKVVRPVAKTEVVDL